MTDANSPPGCFLRIDSGKVLLNLDRTGAANPIDQPLCAREYTAARLPRRVAPSEGRGNPRACVSTAVVPGAAHRHARLLCRAGAAAQPHSHRHIRERELHGVPLVYRGRARCRVSKPRVLREYCVPCEYRARAEYPSSTPRVLR
jgi:hypothetical protein